MRARVNLLFSAALAAIIVSNGKAQIEGPYYAPEPWAGWWWPQYCVAPCPYCPHHLWSDSGPIYQLDTKYFWRDVPRRYWAQEWEYTHHRTTPPGGSPNDGHCHALAAASILEKEEPPDDCGHLSQSDLKGLLTELYYEFEFEWLTPTPSPPPADVWLACQDCLYPSDLRAPNPFMLDFNNNLERNWYAIYGYQVLYWRVADDEVDGVLTLYYEERYTAPRQTGHRPHTIQHAFTGVKIKEEIPGRRVTPVRTTGTWVNPESAPDDALLPKSRALGSVNVNPHLDTVEIGRVINHLTIVLDDDYIDYAVPHSPPGSLWEERPGYAGRCWAAPGHEALIPPVPEQYAMIWRPHWGATGRWNYYIYKTWPQEGDRMNQRTWVYLGTCLWDTVLVDQSAPPFGVWQFLGTRSRQAGIYLGPYIANYWAYPLPCKVYMDALKLEYVGPNEDGGQSAGKVAVLEPKIFHCTPNPFTRTTVIRYQLVQPGNTSLKLYDITGRVVRRLVEGQKNPGAYVVKWDGTDDKGKRLGNGVYILRLETQDVNQNQKVVLSR